jgi:hypothetical protein
LVRKTVSNTRQLVVLMSQTTGEKLAAAIEAASAPPAFVEIKP